MIEIVQVYSIKYSKFGKRMFLEILLCAILQPLLCQYSINLSYPFLLDINYANITTINYNSLDGFNVAFQNKQFKRYSQDFSTHTKFNLQFISQYTNSRAVWWGGNQFSNGSVWWTNISTTVTFSNHFKTFKQHNYTTMNQIQSYTFDERIILYRGFPTQFFGRFNAHSIIVCNQTIRVAYSGRAQPIMNYSQYYLPGAVCDSALFHSNTITTGLDYHTFGYVFFISLSTKEVLRLQVILNFTINYNTSMFDMTHQVKRVTILNASARINKMIMSTSIILMQSNSTGEISFYNVVNSSIGSVDTNIPKYQIFSFFYKFNKYYILQSHGLIQVSFVANTNNLNFVSVISPLPYNTYYIVLTKNVDILYTPNTPYVYKVGRCLDQNIYDGTGSCVAYECQDSNCSSCSMSMSVCSVCNPNFKRDQNFQCIGPSDSIGPQYFFFDSEWMRNLLSFLLKLFKAIISVPAARKIVEPLFYYFGNFDDLFLYSLHNRQYGQTINGLFEQISQIETKKWSYFSFEQLCRLLRVDQKRVKSFLWFQEEYLKSPISQKAEGIFTNSANFLLLETPIVFIGFVLLRAIFQALMRFKISQILRRFDFWVYFTLILFEGNVQQFSFYLTAELKAVFAFVWANKLVKVFIFVFGFSLLLFSLSGYIIGFTFYRKLNRYFTDNNRNILRGNCFLILQSGFRNMVLGVIHSILRESTYGLLMGSLILAQASFFVIFLMGISYKVYIEHIKIWIYLIFTILRIILIITFYLDIEQLNNLQFQYTQKILIFLMVGLTLFSSIFLTISLIIELKIFLFKMFSKKHQKTNSIKQLHIFDFDEVNYPPKKQKIVKFSKDLLLSKKKLQKKLFKIQSLKDKGSKIQLLRKSELLKMINS